MNTEHSTHITLILDRSGSMQDIRDDIIGGINAFLDAQRALQLPITATLVQFDGQDPFEILADNLPIADVQALTGETYQPRGQTPLLDAIGQGIHRISAHLESQKDADKPEKIVMVIVTDGMENASRTFSRAHIGDLIKAKQDAGWEFVFLSSDLSAVQEAQDVNFESSKSARFSKGRVRESMDMMSVKMASFSRRDNTDLSFSNEEREHMDDAASGNGK